MHAALLAAQEQLHCRTFQTHFSLQGTPYQELLTTSVPTHMHRCCRAAEAVKGAVGDPYTLPSARAEFEKSRSEEVKAAENADRKSQVVGWGVGQVSKGLGLWWQQGM